MKYAKPHKYKPSQTFYGFVESFLPYSTMGIFMQNIFKIFFSLACNSLFVITSESKLFHRTI
jgi:hypothetical protein